MNKPGKRTTIYLDPTLHKALKLKSVEIHRSLSTLINNAIRESIQNDAEYPGVFEEGVRETFSVRFRQVLHYWLRRGG